MTLVYVSSCEVARAILLQLPLHPCQSNDNFALILQKLCLYRVPLRILKLYLYFTKDPEAVHYFPGGGGGGPTFFQGGGGPNAIFFIETHICTCYFPGGVSGPPIPL